MAGFQTHISVSTAVGVGYGCWVHYQFGLPWTTASVAGGLCSIAGMLPDLDSDSGVPAREMISFTAAIVPMLLINRLQQSGLTLEQMILAGAPAYLLIRFGFGTLLKHVTVHRGMFHSIPAMVLAGLVTFLISDAGNPTARTLKAIAVSLGFLSHLVLDEIWSVQVSVTGSKLKSSSGTALKFFGPKMGANVVCWGLTLLAGFTVLQEERWEGMSPGHAPQLASPVPARPPVPVYVPPTVAPPEFPPERYEFEPLPDLPVRGPRPAAVTDGGGRITPRKPTTQARRPLPEFYER